MVKLAYTQDLGSCVARRAGSTPVTRTRKKHFGRSAFLMKRALRHMKNEADFVYEAHLRCMNLRRNASLTNNIESL